MSTSSRSALRDSTEDAPLLVAVEATRLLREVRGIGRYVRALLPRLVALRPGLRLALFAGSRADVAALAEVASRDPSLRERTVVRHVREMPRSGADVFWYPWNIASPAPARGAVVVTVHDVAPLALPDPRWTAWRKNFRWRRRYAATARRATVIVSDSSFTSDEVHRMLGFPRDRIHLALLAADDVAIPPPGADEGTLARLGVRAPFVLTVGAADRRKNHALLERAMRRAVEAHPRATLVMAGPRRRGVTQPPDAPWIRMLGFVSDSDLTALYRAATALVMPSTYEGFGLPVLEAMRLGTPVICARASSLPEVAGDAAAWVEPNDEGALASAISRVLADEDLRSRMRAAGLAQAARFTWDETARRTLHAFDEARRLCGDGPRSGPVASGLVE
jgi:glycosyltransferase involved in cell wall biosynthesis